MISIGNGWTSRKTPCRFPKGGRERLVRSGRRSAKFEAALASNWGIEHAAGVASGMDAIEISLKILGCHAGRPGPNNADFSLRHHARDFEGGRGSGVCRHRRATAFSILIAAAIFFGADPTFVSSCRCISTVMLSICLDCALCARSSPPHRRGLCPIHRRAFSMARPLGPQASLPRQVFIPPRTWARSATAERSSPPIPNSARKPRRYATTANPPNTAMS